MHCAVSQLARGNTVELAMNFFCFAAESIDSAAKLA